MKYRFIFLSSFILSSIFLILWFQVNYETKQLEKQLRTIEKNIKVLDESNKVLLSEFAAYSSPEYIRKLSSIYLEDIIVNEERILVFTEKKFINKINKLNLIIPTSTNNYLSTNNKGNLN